MKNNPKKQHKITTLIHKGHRLLQQGLPKKAAPVFRKALKIEADNFDALQSLGAVMLQLKQYPEAIRYLQKAAALNANVPGLLCNLGLCYRYNDDDEKAVAYFEQAIQVDASFAAAYFNLALCQINKHSYQQALSTLQRAERCRPGHFGTLQQMAYVLEQLGHFPDAIVYYKHALQIEPENPGLLFSLGKALQSNRQYQDAVDAYTRLLQLENSHLEAHAKLADLLESINRPEEAQQHAERVLKEKPKHALASLVMARIERRRKDFLAAKNRLLALDQDTNDIGAAVQSELGIILDRLGEHSTAFAAFEKANAIMSRLPSAEIIDQQAAFKLIDASLAWLSTRNIHNMSPMDDGLPSPIFLTGFPRSGTTLTEQILASTPGVVTGDELTTLHDMATHLSEIVGRTIDYPSGIDNFDAQDIQKLRQHYWEQTKRLLPEVSRSEHFVDKMPLNIIHLGLVEKIFPDSKIIVALRDPRDVCLSCFMQLFQLNESMIQLLTMDNTTKYYSAVMSLWLRYREQSSLQWMESRYEDIVTDIASSTEKLGRFLGLDHAGNAAAFYQQASERMISTPSYQDVGTPIYQRAKGRWENYREQIQDSLENLRPFVQAFGYQEIDNLSLLSR